MPSMKTRIGTPYYVAPEVIVAASEGPYGLKCDLWSVGVIVYFMLLGHPPFCEETDNRLFKKIVTCDYKLPSSEDNGNDEVIVSEEAVDFIKKLLVVDPLKRLSAAEALEEKWL